MNIFMESKDGALENYISMEFTRIALSSDQCILKKFCIFKNRLDSLLIGILTKFSVDPYYEPLSRFMIIYVLFNYYNNLYP